MGVVEGHEVELVKGMKEMGNKSMSEVEAKGLGGSVAGKDNVRGGAKLVVREVGAPRGIGSREETLNGSRAQHVLVGRVGGGVELLGLPIVVKVLGPKRKRWPKWLPRWSTVKGRN